MTLTKGDKRLQPARRDAELAKRTDNGAGPAATKAQVGGLAPHRIRMPIDREFDLWELAHEISLCANGLLGLRVDNRAVEGKVNSRGHRFREFAGKTDTCVDAASLGEMVVERWVPEGSLVDVRACDLVQ